MNFLTGDDAPTPPQRHWGDEDLKRFYSLVNSHMQGAYAAALGHSTRGYDKSDQIGRGFMRATELALQEMGLRPKED